MRDIFCKNCTLKNRERVIVLQTRYIEYEGEEKFWVHSDTGEHLCITEVAEPPPAPPPAPGEVDPAIRSVRRFLSKQGATHANILNAVDIVKMVDDARSTQQEDTGRK